MKAYKDRWDSDLARDIEASKYIRIPFKERKMLSNPYMKEHISHDALYYISVYKMALRYSERWRPKSEVELDSTIQIFCEAVAAVNDIGKKSEVERVRPHRQHLYDYSVLSQVTGPRRRRCASSHYKAPRI